MGYTEAEKKRKIEVNIEPVIAKLQRLLEPFQIGPIRRYKGKNVKEGQVLLVVPIDKDRDLKIEIDVEKMLRRPHEYFDGIADNIVTLIRQSDKRRFEKCRITG